MALSTTERAELEALRDVTKRLLHFGGDDSVLMPWIDAHRLHADEPYIGCPFCRDRFVTVQAVVDWLRARGSDMDYEVQRFVDDFAVTPALNETEGPDGR